MVAIPTVIAGAVGLFLTTSGFVTASAALAALPVILAATCLGLLIGTIWAAALGQNIVATLYAVFLGFYLSYGVMQLGLAHDWFHIAPSDAGQVVQVYLICWIFVIVMLTLATLPLPWTFTLLLALVDGALALLLVSVMTGSTLARLGAAGGVGAFTLVAVYLYFHVMSVAFGGRGLPLGRPLVSA
jgi:succinate-acetate transporter protein